MNKHVVTALFFILALGSLALYGPLQTVSQLGGVITAKLYESAIATCQAAHNLTDDPAANFSLLDINNDGTNDVLFYQADEQTCGNVGCTVYMCLQKKDTSEPIPFSYAAADIQPKQTYTNNMRDFIITTKQEEVIELTWDGQRYLIAD